MPRATVIDKPTKVDLKSLGTDAPGSLDRDETIVETNKLGARLAELQDLMYFAGMHSMLIVLQGMDTSGKDGTIRNILQFSNAQGTRAVPFKAPTPEEGAHDFLWRIHKETPELGGVTIFNRSHYEDVLIVRVHELVAKAEWSARYDRINEFEKLLATNKTIVRKFFLHISKEEQEKRLIAREQDTTKSWKLSVVDWTEREKWADYRDAYEDAIGKCAAKDAPWTIVPSNAKWYRNYVVTKELVAALEGEKDAWIEHLKKVGETAKLQIAAFRQTAK